ncbi:Transcription factor GLABRA 3-like protein, partial [Drosera capensis]
NCTYIPGRKSSFATWKSESGTEHYRLPSRQKTLKKVLYTTWITPQKMLKDGGKNRPLLASNAPKLSGVPLKHLGLRSILPSIDKIAKTRILDEGIEYLQEIVARVEELKSCINLAESTHETRRRYTDMMERTADNYENKRTDDGKKPWINKRKACDIDETESDLSKAIPADNTSLDMKVSIGEHEVQIDLRCPWREYLVLDIMEATQFSHPPSIASSS